MATVTFGLIHSKQNKWQQKHLGSYIQSKTNGNRNIWAHTFKAKQMATETFGLIRSKQNKWQQKHLGSYVQSKTNGNRNIWAHTFKTKQRARSRFVQHKTKQLCPLPLRFAELPNQSDLSTMSHRVGDIEFQVWQ